MSQVGTDSLLLQLVAPYKAQMETEMQEVIGETDTTLFKQQPECTLGNFIADAMLQKAKEINPAVDAAVMNYGGIRVSYIQPGAVTVKNMYELMPFDNMLCIVEMNGSTLREFCNHMADAKGWPVNGITYRITPAKQASGILINGKPLDENKTYHIATNDYVANGGDKCSFLIPLKKQQTNIFIREVLIAYVKNLRGRPLHPGIEKRVSYE